LTRQRLYTWDAEDTVEGAQTGENTMGKHFISNILCLLPPAQIINPANMCAGGFEISKLFPSTPEQLVK
jgi:hypothetical protein